MRFKDEEFGLGVRPENQASRHVPPPSFRRVSPQGMAEPGPVRCSARPQLHLLLPGQLFDALVGRGREP